MCVVMVVGPFVPLRGSLSPQTSHGNQPLEQGVKQEPVAAVICHLSSFNVWHQSVHPFARPMVATNREMSFQGPF